MNVLGIDTSTAASAACVLRSDGEAFEVRPPVEALAARSAHSAELMPAVADCLDRSGLGYSDLDAIAVGVGPGSFTGLRIGVATARALSHASGAELRPVSSLAALAMGIEERVRLPLIDARRGELFAALYEDGERHLRPFAAAPEVVVERVRETGLDPLAAGDGSLRFLDVLEAAGVRIAAAGSPAHVVRGLSICRAAADSPATPPEAVLPDYLRLPDATPQAPT
ncbi:MAG TPA: tRNA (adenosine(37)-N6)-threonylcarbamoyltransferase complex dimerization subunit type 1 TsaB [Thermoleophilaceae bacterium]|nr:tRNA (adenosine(37)-N6)-threonylcarbamoyltransferase complex dimerization subunit type 1 TsaB [Thermoleophilaceae bacterium]